MDTFTRQNKFYYSEKYIGMDIKVWSQNLSSHDIRVKILS